jgi:hypothetical protein
MKNAALILRLEVYAVMPTFKESCWFLLVTMITAEEKPVVLA